MSGHSANIQETGIREAQFMDLPRFATSGGEVLRMLRPASPMWKNFPAGLGEIYFSRIEPGVVRAWKLHTEQTGMFAVPSGVARFVLYDARADSPTLGVLANLVLGLPDNYRLLRVPCGVWYGFKCLGDATAVICNCADRPHDPEETVRLPQDDPSIPFKW